MDVAMMLLLFEIPCEVRVVLVIVRLENLFAFAFDLRLVWVW